jgi:hypothetical protein
MSIGMNYRAAVINRFYRRPGAQALAGRIEAFCREVNTDSLDRFEALVEACAGREDLSDPAAEKAVRDIACDEADSRNVLELEARAIVRAIDAFATVARTTNRPLPPNGRALPRTLGFPAAVLLASGLACSSMSEMAAPPLEAGPPDARPEMSEMAAPPLDAGPSDAGADMSEMAAPPLDAGPTDAGTDAANEGVVKPDVGKDEPIMSETDARPLDLRRDEPIMSEIDAMPLDLRRDEPFMAEVAAPPLDAGKDTKG